MTGVRDTGTGGETAERFWAKVEKTDACWLWTGTIARGERGGYGYFHVSTAVGRQRAHRFAYEMLVGPIPQGLTIDHLCRNRACVNPEHLEPVTSRENTLRGFGAPARNARKTHCKRGHEFTPENTYRSRKGRECVACRSLAGRIRKGTA